jgi:hypothetical protein
MFATPFMWELKMVVFCAEFCYCINNLEAQKDKSYAKYSLVYAVFSADCCVYRALYLLYVS